MSAPATVAAVIRHAPLARAVIRHAAPVMARPEAAAARIRHHADHPADRSRRTVVRPRRRPRP